MPARALLSAACAFLFWITAAPAAAQTRSPAVFASAPATWWMQPADALSPLRRHTRDILFQEGRRRRAPGTVLMIVGGSVAAVGILTDESVLIVGGVVVAAVGLYRYLQ
jgi:hypothetical protein